ncbi:MAG: GNAT family N-acetyltransferase, partial [Acidimicrobiia bacterium]
MSEPEIREAGQDDVPGILETLRLSLGETPLLKRTAALWAWKHHQNPFGRSIVLVADDDGVIAGVRALMRWDLVTPSGAVVRCVRPVDTATHPQFLRRGIFRTLTMSALDIARDNHIDLVFNTPNEKSAPGYLRMGWQHVSWIGAQVRFRVGRVALPSQSQPPSIEHIAPGAAPAWQIPTSLHAEPARAMRTPHSEQYLDWRFKTHPSASYGWVTGSLESGLVVR